MAAPPRRYRAYKGKVEMRVKCRVRYDERWAPAGLFVPTRYIKIEPYDVPVGGSVCYAPHTRSFPISSPQSIVRCTFLIGDARSKSRKEGASFLCGAIRTSSPTRVIWTRVPAANPYATLFGKRTAILLPHFCMAVCIMC